MVSGILINLQINDKMPRSMDKKAAASSKYKKMRGIPKALGVDTKQ